MYSILSGTSFEECKFLSLACSLWHDMSCLSYNAIFHSHPWFSKFPFVWHYPSLKWNWHNLEHFILCRNIFCWYSDLNSAKFQKLGFGAWDNTEAVVGRRQKEPRATTGGSSRINWFITFSATTDRKISYFFTTNLSCSEKRSQFDPCNFFHRQICLLVVSSSCDSYSRVFESLVSLIFIAIEIGKWKTVLTECLI